jgi:hypothetical protein
MPNYDDILQSKISELENGLPIESVLQELPDEAQDLEPLLRLAVAVRTLPHPEPIVHDVMAQRQTILQAAQTAVQTTPRPTFRFPWFPSLNWLKSPAGFAMAGAAIFFLVLVISGAAAWMDNRNMDTARIENVVGQVQVATNKEATEWKNLTNGDRINQGQHVRTLGASSASLVFFEGTRTFVSAHSELALTTLNGSSGDKLQVEMEQIAGETYHKVTPLKGDSSFFLVRTLSGVASVHGTSFNVRVNEGGKTLVAVNTGEVRVSNENDEVTLLPGQATLANPDGDIDQPNYQFTVTGSLMSMEEFQWEVSGIFFTIAETTSISGDPQIGDTVKVTGRVMEDGEHIADTVEPASTEEQDASFTGTLEAMDGSDWVISGFVIAVDEATELVGEMAVGGPVLVTYNLLDDGTWLALKIEALVEETELPEPTPTATADPRARPSYEFSPDELTAYNCEDNSYSVTGSMRNTSNDAKDYAANVQLGYLIDRGGEYVNSVQLSPAGWDRIDAAETVSFTVNVNMTEAWAEAEEGSEVKVRVFVASATNRPDHLNGRVTITLIAGCQITPEPTDVTATPEITETATPTPDLTVTPTLEGTVTPTAEPTETGQCTGANPHPTGMKLAQRYGVSYEETGKLV